VLRRRDPFRNTIDFLFSAHGMLADGAGCRREQREDREPGFLSSGLLNTDRPRSIVAGGSHKAETKKVRVTKNRMK
jgi:hypothetical protein